MKPLRAICLAILLLVCVGAAWIAYEAYSFLETAPAKEGKEIYFDVSPGASLQTIARELREKGLITDARKFMLLARYRNCADKLQSGRFALNSGWKPGRIMDILASGKGTLYRVTIPEGLTWWQTGRLLEKAGFVKFDDFSKVVSNPEFLRHYGIPFTTAEGFLMPDTYLLPKPRSAMATEPPTNDAANQDAKNEWQAQARMVAGRMVDNFWRKANTFWPHNQDGASQSISRPSRTDLKKWVTLASIVEKETGIDSERPRVAGVYANRLRRNMLLQADPTVIYGLGPDFSGNLRRADLENTANVYNTYARAGLPPGPIASFGVAALKAAINPEKHDYLYFVAKTDGGEHTFSRNLGEHNEAVREYRRQKRQ